MPNQKIVHRYRVASVVFAVLGALSGFTALLGWILGNDGLKGGFIENITMKANTAIALLLASLSLLLLWPQRTGALRLWLGRVLALLVAVLGAATLSEHLLHVDLGIDQILFRESVGALGTASPNRMGLPASTCLLLLGIALLLLDVRTRRGRAPYQYLLLPVLAIPTISALGYLYHVPELYGIGGMTGIALQTAGSLLLLASSALLARPEAGFMRRLVGRDSGALLTRRLLPWALLLPVALTLVRLAGERAGFYSTEVGRPILSFAFMSAFATLVWWTAAIVSRQEQAAERQRSEIQGRLTQSLETMNDAFVACGPDWRITYMNATAERVNSARRDEAVGQDFWTAFPDAIGTDVERQYRRAMQDRVPLKFETFYEPYQRYFEIEVLPTSDGGLATYGRDITDRRRALDVLEDADRRKNRFLATLAHELRNPLAPVRNAVHMLRLKGRAEPDVAWAHAVIDRQVDHLSRLIEDLMDVSRISYGKLELRKERVTLEEVIAGAIESSRPFIEANRHQLIVRLPEQTLLLDADSVRLAQVFMNLLTNAAKYTPAGGTITLSAERQGSDAVARVTDTGVGLTAEQMPHLFEMFYQTEEILKRTQGGLGIGLALVRHLVELHGGSVTAESAGSNQGSTFCVRLPLAADQTRSEAGSAASGPPFRLEGRRVLVVDDNRDAATSLVRLLQMTGAQVQSAFDGVEAMALIDACEFDVALLDIGLPKVSGHDLARAIRARNWGKQATLVALTGWGQDEDRELSRDAGFDHHLVKPVSPSSLVNLLAGTSTA